MTPADPIALPAWIRIGGHITELAATHYRVAGLHRIAAIGDFVYARKHDLDHPGIIIGLDETGATVKPVRPALGVGIGTPVWHSGPLIIKPNDDWLGRSVNALAEPIDHLGPLRHGACAVPVGIDPPFAFDRGPLGPALTTGVHAIDVFTPLTVGQRIGIFAGSGVGKSTLLSMLAQMTGFDVTICVLVGERGREVADTIAAFDPERRKSCIFVVSTSAESPVHRKIAPQTAMTIAEHFRHRGLKVLLVMDSITRFAQAAREIALAAGEPPAARGFPPSVFSDISHLVERAGPGQAGQGSITAIFSVLVEGDDRNEPISDAVRGALDGHIILQRHIAEQGRYPAIDPLASISRLAPICWSREQETQVRRLQSLIARFEDSRDLRAMGGYTPGHDRELDEAVRLVPKLYQLLAQTGTADAGSNAYQAIDELLAASP